MNNILELIPQLYVPVKLPLAQETHSIKPYTFGDMKTLIKISEEYTESKDKKESSKNVINVLVDLCEKSLKMKYNVYNLNLVDFLYLILQLKKISSGETTELIYKCHDCDTKRNFKFNPDDCKIKNKNDSDDIVQLKTEDPIFIHLKKFTVQILLDNLDRFDDELDSFDIVYLLASMIDGIEFKEDLTQNIDIETLIEFVKNMPASSIEPLKRAVKNRPTLYWEEQFECESCKTLNYIRLETIDDFFLTLL